LIVVLVSYQNCGQFQSNSNGVANPSLTELDISQEILVQKGQELFASRCASCHGPIDTTDKIGRNADQIADAIINIPQMNSLADLPVDEVEAIAAALIYQANGGGVVFNEAGRMQFECQPGTMSLNPLLVLNNREIVASLNQILDLVSNNLKNDSEYNQMVIDLPNDILLNKHLSYVEQPQLITEQSTVAYLNLSFRAGQLLANSQDLQRFPGTNGCLVQSSISPNCHRDFVRSLASYAFRRPISTQEGNEISERLWDDSLSKQDQIILTFAALTQDPEFQYKVFNKGEAVTVNRIRLTDHELATKLSFLIAGTPPDAELRQLASQGSLRQPNVLSAQVDRLLNSEGGAQTVVRLFREAFGYDYFETFIYDDDFRDGIRLNGLQESMVAELDDFFIHHTLRSNGTYSDLLTSRYSNFQGNALTQIYGVTAGEKTLPTERSGFLNRAAMLTKRSGFQASPIKRGLKVLEDVLCTSVGAPPQNAPTAITAVENEINTTRHNAEVASQAAGSTCVFCHDRINPLGFAFENFDTLGRARTQERIFDGMGRVIASLPVNTQIQTNELGLETQSANNSVDLSLQLGNSDRALMCFAKKLKKFESRVEVSAADNCHMSQALDTLYGQSGQQGSIREAIKAIVMAEEFLYWNYQE
jgi:hypothetical protein